MKKKLLIMFFIFVLLINVKASNSFSIDKDIKFNMEDEVISKFSKEYNLSYEIKYDDVGNEIIDLSKKVTYLLLGTKNYQVENYKDFYRRHKEFLKLRYAPAIPKDDKTLSGYDENSQEYKDDLISGFAVPGMFNKINELDIKYSTFGDIRVSKSNDTILSVVLLPSVSMKEEDPKDPLNYHEIHTNLILYYYFKEYNGEYKLYYLYGETKENIEEYLNSINENSKSNQASIAPEYDSSLNNLYNTNKLKSITNQELNNIYDNNKDKMVTLLSYYNSNYEGGSSFIGNGFFINKGLIVTTYDFLLRVLKNGQTLNVISNNKSLVLDGIVTVNKKANIAVLKLKEELGTGIKLSNDIKIGEPVISISNKTIGYTINKGLLVSNDNYYQSTIPLSLSDEGSLIFNINGDVVGMNTSVLINSPSSLQVPYEALIEVQDKFNNIDFNSIKVIEFEELKKYFYVTYGLEEERLDLSNKMWEKVNKITNISDNIHLKLIKANYQSGYISLRYLNSMAGYTNTMNMSISFRKNLIDKGFVEKLNSDRKYIYEKDNYQITIMEEFDYLLVVIKL